jgi:hypothetical protein
LRKWEIAGKRGRNTPKAVDSSAQGSTLGKRATKGAYPERVEYSLAAGIKSTRIAPHIEHRIDARIRDTRLGKLSFDGVALG